MVREIQAFGPGPESPQGGKQGIGDKKMIKSFADSLIPSSTVASSRSYSKGSHIQKSCCLKERNEVIGKRVQSGLRAPNFSRVESEIKIPT